MELEVPTYNRVVQFEQLFGKRTVSLPLSAAFFNADHNVLIEI